MNATAVQPKTFTTMTEAIRVAGEDAQAKQRGNFVIVQVDKERYGYLPTDSPLGSIEDLLGDQFGTNAHIAGRYAWNGTTWERLNAQGLKEKTAGGNNTS